MSTTQRMTLIGMSNNDTSFFDSLTLPEGYDKETFINTLLLEHGEKCVLYTNPAFMEMAMSIWSDKWELELTRIYNALTTEYNPIWNYDRNEDTNETDKPDNVVTRTHNNTDTTTNRYDVVSEQNVNGVSENQISADNSSVYQPDNKNISNFGKNTTSNDGTITDAHTGTITDTEKGTRSNVTRKSHVWGNIGVTTSTQMIESETLIRAKRNLYDIAARLFANELLIGIY